MYRFQLLACTLMILAFAFAMNVEAGEKSDSKVKVSATASKPGADGKQKVTITIAIEKGWYIYANPVKSEDFEENATRVSFLKGKEKIKGANVTFPTGKTKETIVGKTKIRYNVYEDKVVIDAVVPRAAGDTSPLTVAVEVNSCSGGTCLAPGTVRVTVP